MAGYTRRLATIAVCVSFPVTHLSLVRRVRSSDADTRARAHDALAAVYWAPIYAHVRFTHRQEPADAEDLTQGFFVDALRRDLFARYDPARARFRTFVRRCVDSYVANALQAERRQKRGGGAPLLSVDAADVEHCLTTDDDATSRDADANFHREWVRSLLLTSVTRLRERYEAAGRVVHLALFERYDMADEDDGRPTYAELAAEFRIPPTQVTNWLAATRRDFRSIVLDTIRDLSGSDEEFHDDVRSLLGIDAS
jgi:DNA-directed RNA polymerase specialized sigma24 family protein